MRVLLDTHTFLWWINNDSQLSAQARTIIGDANNDLFFSAVSGLELAIKAQIDKLKLPSDLEQFVPDQLSANAIDPLPVELKHTLHVYRLPLLHRDPFDRLLIAQSQLENLPLLTIDPQIGQYDIQVIW